MGLFYNVPEPTWLKQQVCHHIIMLHSDICAKIENILCQSVTAHFRIVTASTPEDWQLVHLRIVTDSTHDGCLRSSLLLLQQWNNWSEICKEVSEISNGRLKHLLMPAIIKTDIENTQTVIITFSKSVGFPRWMVRVTSVVPSLQC